MEGPWFILMMQSYIANCCAGTAQCKQAMAELIPVAKQWQMEEPESEDPILLVCSKVVLRRGEKPACRSLRVPGKLPIYTS